MAVAQGNKYTHIAHTISSQPPPSIPSCDAHCLSGLNPDPKKKNRDLLSGAMPARAQEILRQLNCKRSGDATREEAMAVGCCVTPLD